MKSAQIYVNKRRFVDLLSEAYELDGRTVKRISYIRDPKNSLEFVHIEYPSGRVDRINVTWCSLEAIGMEIAQAIAGFPLKTQYEGR